MRSTTSFYGQLMSTPSLLITGICALFFLFPSGIIAQNNNGRLDLLEELGTKESVPIRLPGGIHLATDVYLPITSDSLVFATSILGQSIQLELIPKGTQLVVYPTYKDSTGNWVPNPNPYQLPLILSRTPYDKGGIAAAGNLIPLLGYAFANQDIRGRYESEGVYLPMYSDGWKKAPYHNFNHLLDISSSTDSTNGRFHEDGWTAYQYLLNDYTKQYDLDGDGIKETTATVCNGSMGTAGASAFGIPHFQLMASNYIDPSPNKKGLKANLAIVATAEHYNTTGYHNGVFRQGLVQNWLETEMSSIEDSIGTDNSRTNALHTPFDFGFATKAQVLDHAVQNYTSYKYPGTGLANAYPNSLGRADMDVSGTMVDANGFGSPTGTQSRYTNMNVPTYHLTGWYDLFVDGQIKTWQKLKQHTNSRQKIIIGPWAHTSITMRESGDVTYPPQAAELLGFDGSGFGLDLSNLANINLAKIWGTEPLEFMRYSLNNNGYVQLGQPIIRIPESQVWQGGSNLQVRIPSEDYDLTLAQLLNFLGGQGGLPDLPIEARIGILPATNLNIPFPNLSGTLPSLPFLITSPIPETQTIDFDTIPDLRFYVIGPTDSLQGNEQAGNYWTASPDFPPANVNYRSLYLHQNGNLDANRPSTDEGQVSYVHDPNNPVQTVGGGNLFIETPDGRSSHGQMQLNDSLVANSTLYHPGVVQFETSTFTDTFSMVGFPKATLYAISEPQGVSAGETDTDFFIRIVDVYPDGRELLVIEGAVNARARAYAKSLYQDNEDKNAPFSNIQIGETYEYQFNLLPIAYTFGKQHKMKVLISSSNYPRYRSNPNIPIEAGDFFRSTPNDGQSYTYQGQNYQARIANNSIRFSDSLASRIELPIYGVDPFVSIIKIPNLVAITQVQVQPNPSSDWISITTEQALEGSLQVYNALGQLVHQQNLSGQEQQVNVAQLAAGWYQIQLITKQQGKLQASFIKK